MFRETAKTSKQAHVSKKSNKEIWQMELF